MRRLNSMRSPSATHALALLFLAAACTKANFAPVPDGGGRRDSTGDLGSCTSSSKACTAEDPPVPPCDPVCQTGCEGCAKCTLALDGTRTCGPFGDHKTGESCDITFPDSSSLYDDCQPGDICLIADSGFGYSYCFTFCREKGDCAGGAACAARPIPSSAENAMVCDPPYADCDLGSSDSCCDPINQNGCQPNRSCYLVSPNPETGSSRTVCEFSTGNKAKQTCQSSRECLPGLGCSGAGFCQKVCDPNTKDPCSGGPCSMGLGSGTKYGYCPI